MRENYAGLGSASSNPLSILDMQKMQEQASKDTKPIDWLDLGMGILERENTLFSGIKEERRSAEADGVPDPEFSITEEDLPQLKELKLSDSEVDYLKRAKSREAYEARINFIKEDRSHREMLDRAGFAGTVATIAAGVFDPLTMPLETIAGYAVAAKSASILAGALKAGGLAAASNVATEAVLMQGDTQRSSEDLIYAAVGGMALGGLLGGVSAKLAGKVSPDNDLDELIGASSKIDEENIVPSGETLSLPAPRIAGYLVDKTKVKSIYDGEIKLLGQKPAGLLEDQKAIDARTALDLDNIAAEEAQKAIHQAQLAKAQADLTELTNNPNFLSDVALHNKLRETLKGDIEAGKGLTTMERLTERATKMDAEIEAAASNLKAHEKTKPVRKRAVERQFIAEQDALIAKQNDIIDKANAELKAVSDAKALAEKAKKSAETIKKSSESLAPVAKAKRAAEIALSKAKAEIQKAYTKSAVKKLDSYKSKLDAAEATYKKYKGKVKGGKMTEAETALYEAAKRDRVTYKKAYDKQVKLRDSFDNAANQKKVQDAEAALSKAESANKIAEARHKGVLEEQTKVIDASKKANSKLKTRENAANKKIEAAKAAIDEANANKARDFKGEDKKAKAEYKAKAEELKKKHDDLTSSRSKLQEEIELKDKASKAHAKDAMLRKGEVPEDMREVFEKLKKEHQGYAVGYRTYKMRLLKDEIAGLTRQIANRDRYIDAIMERVERATRPPDAPWIVTDTVKIVGSDASSAPIKPTGIRPPKVSKKFGKESLNKPSKAEEKILKQDAEMDAKVKEEIKGDGTPEKPPLNDVDQNSADLYNTERLSKLGDVRKKVLEYASMVVPALGKGGAIGSRLSRSKILAIRGLAGMIASMPQGGVKLPCAAAVSAKNLATVVRLHTPAVEAVQSAMRKSGYNAFSINSNAGQEFLDAFHDQVALYIITSKKPTGKFAEEIIKAGDACRNVFKESLNMRKQAGVRGFEHVESTPDYFTLTFEYRKMQATIDRMGADGAATVKAFISDAYLNGKVLSRMANKAKAKQIADLLAGAQMERTLSKTDQASFQAKMHNYFNAGTVEFLKKSMREAGVPDIEVQTWLDAMTKVDQQLHVSNRAKASFGADLAYTRDGMRMTDLIDTDIDVAMRYGREASADAGLATSGLKSKADYGNVKEDIAVTTKDDLDKRVRDGEITPQERDRQLERMQEEFDMLDDVVKKIYGRDLDADEFGKVGKLVKASRITRALASAAMLGKLGITTTVEFANVMAKFGFFNTIKELKHFKINPKKFNKNDAQMEEWAKVFGAYGHTEGWYYGKARGSNISTNFDQIGGKLDVYLRTANEVAGFTSFFKHVQHGLEEVGMRLQINELDKVAKQAGEKRFKVPEDLYNEFARHGLSPSELDDALTFLRTTRKTVDVNGKAFDIPDIDKMPYELRNRLGASMLYLMNRIVQRQMAGDELPIMMRETGKFLFQFMAYPIAAIEKQLVYGMRFHKARTMAAMLFGMGLGYLQFGGKTWISAQLSDDPDAYWEEAMQPKNAIIASALATGALGSTLGVGLNAMATLGFVPDELMSKPMQQGASTMAKAPPAAAYAIGVAKQPAKFLGHAYDAYNDEIDYEQLNKDAAAATRYIPVVDSAMLRLGAAIINKSREEF